jgi:putative transcriptional regulator
MTQADLADRVGVTRQTIIAIERGRYSPSLETAFQIARVFNVPLTEVFQYPDSETWPDLAATRRTRGGPRHDHEDARANGPLPAAAPRSRTRRARPAAA